MNNRNNLLLSAKKYLKFGFDVIPLIPQTKKPALKWDDWLKNLSFASLDAHWGKNCNHELGFIIGKGVVVFDADSDESYQALLNLEKKHQLEPLMKVSTKKGHHHYYRVPSNVVAKTNSHSTEKHPERIDVKTGRSMVVLPPSTGKTLVKNVVDHSSELTAVTQGFIDDVDRHNGRQPSSIKPIRVVKPPIKKKPNQKPYLPRNPNHNYLIKLIEDIDPDHSYHTWLDVLMAISHETNGSEEGLLIADQWSSTGSKYKGTHEVATKWHSFNPNHDKPITIGTIYHLRKVLGLPHMRPSGFEALDVNTIIVDPSNNGDHPE